MTRYASQVAMLGPMYAEWQRQCCDIASDIAHIEIT